MIRLLGAQQGKGKIEYRIMLGATNLQGHRAAPPSIIREYDEETVSVVVGQFVRGDSRVEGPGELHAKVTDRQSPGSNACMQAVQLISSLDCNVRGL